MGKEVIPFIGPLFNVSINALKDGGKDDVNGITRMNALKLLGSLLANEGGNLFKVGSKEEKEETEHKLITVKKVLEETSRSDSVKNVRELASTIKELIFKKD